MFLTGGANPANLDHRMVDGKTQVIGFGNQFPVVVLQLGDPLAVAADQKLRGGSMPGMHAGDKGIFTFDPVHKSFGKQKIERPVNYRRRNFFLRMKSIQLPEDIVGAHRLMAGEQDFQDLSPSRGQAQLAPFADSLRLR